MKHRSIATGASALLVVALTAGAGLAGAKDTKARYTPFEDFTPIAASSACTPSTTEPFVIPSGYEQFVVAEEPDGGTIDLWDMHTQNEDGKDKARYLYRTHETGTNGMLSVTDLSTGTTEVLAQRADWERFDGLVWTPWNTLLAAEEVTNDGVDDPAFPAAEAGLVYEYFIDPDDPSELETDNPLDTVAPFDDGVATRPAIGSRSHEGMRFDRHGNLYGISEVNPGGIFKFTPDSKGNLSSGTLYVLDTPNGHDGAGSWIEISDAGAMTNSQTEATSKGANGYSRPEDVETDESTGKDKNNGGQTLYVAVTGTDEVLAIDLRKKDAPFVYDYVYNAAHGTSTTPNATSEFDAPDNLALDEKGNLAITEDPGGEPPTKTKGDDIWIAAPPKGGHPQAASTVQRFATLKDCFAEPSGVYFAMDETEKWTKGTAWEDFVEDETLFVHRMHSGQDGFTADQSIAISPID